MLAYHLFKIRRRMQAYVKHGIVQGDETVALTDGTGVRKLRMVGRRTVANSSSAAKQQRQPDTDLYAVCRRRRSQAATAGRRAVHSIQRDASLSPDGKWLAYVSDESGQGEVFVQAMSDPNTRAQISSDGEHSSPRWARSGNELFFLVQGRSSCR
jgi:hypothetical protein